MEDNDNPFEDYYKETFKLDPEKMLEAKDNDAFLKSLEDRPVPKDVSADAKVIQASINLFIKALTVLIDKVFAKEKENGTRHDLIVTLVVGGLAFTLANVYYLITRSLGIKMTKEQYEMTFMGMYKSALKDIPKEE